MTETIEAPVAERTFEPWPKVPRLNKLIVVTEKIDGTNAAVVVTPEGDVYAQSRTRIITPESSKTDNFGFAAWVDANKDALAEQLGVGRHFGEWWGQGIQRGYGLDHRRFSLFNTNRWHVEDDSFRAIAAPLCHVVPVLMQTNDASEGFDHASILDQLSVSGSMAAPGYMNPEGVMIYHTAAGQTFKLTYEAGPKGAPGL